MGAGSSASAGPGQYSLDDLLTHLSAEGVLTAAKVIATGDDMRLPLPLDYLQDKGAFEGAETPDAIIALDLDKFRTFFVRIGARECGARLIRNF